MPVLESICKTLTSREKLLRGGKLEDCDGRRLAEPGLGCVRSSACLALIMRGLYQPTPEHYIQMGYIPCMTIFGTNILIVAAPPEVGPFVVCWLTLDSCVCIA